MHFSNHFELSLTVATQFVRHLQIESLVYKLPNTFGHLNYDVDKKTSFKFMAFQTTKNFSSVRNLQNGKEKCAEYTCEVVLKRKL